MGIFTKFALIFTLFLIVLSGQTKAQDDKYKTDRDNIENLKNELLNELAEDEFIENMDGNYNLTYDFEVDILKINRKTRGNKTADKYREIILKYYSPDTEGTFIMSKPYESSTITGEIIGIKLDK